MYKTGCLLITGLVLTGCNTIGSEYHSSDYYLPDYYPSSSLIYGSGYYYPYTERHTSYYTYRPVIKVREPVKPPRLNHHLVRDDRHPFHVRHPSSTGVRHDRDRQHGKDRDRVKHHHHKPRAVTDSKPQVFTRDRINRVQPGSTKEYHWRDKRRDHKKSRRIRIRSNHSGANSNGKTYRWSN